MLVPVANRLLALACRLSAAGFYRRAQDLEAWQLGRLRRYLRANATTEFGRAYGFATIGGYADFARRLPLSTYDDYRPWVDRIRAGYGGVLTREAVRLLEPTSGSGGGSKLIPYTAGLRAEYMAAVRPWLADLYRQRPRLLDGSAYWSVSPLSDEQLAPASAVAVGFADDAAYFGPLAGLVRRVQPVPGSLRRQRSVRNFRFLTAVLLASAADLRLFSVWNPSFLTILLDAMPPLAEALVASIHDGRLRWPDPEAVVGSWQLRPDPARAREVAAAFASADWPLALWPELALVSCWTDGQSALGLPALRTRLPGVEIQGKGLLATEGVVSFPVFASESSVLAAGSHFFEFLGDDGTSYLAHQLRPGQRAKVVLTTAGGLYRYQLGDIVEVGRAFRGLPSLRFLGRDAQCDLTGEKLSELSVSQALHTLPELAGTAFVLLAPWRGPATWHYALLVEPGQGLEGDRLDAWAEGLDSILRSEFHYDYARRLGQLGPLLACRLEAGAASRYQAFLAAKGMKLGDIKASSLYTAVDIADCFYEMNSLIAGREA